MLHSLRKKLTLLYTVSTGLILTAVLLFVMINSQIQLNAEKKNSFSNTFATVSKYVQINNEVSHLWMSQTEASNHLIIYIEDNGTPLLYTGGFYTPTKRFALVQKTKDRALQDNINTSIRPTSLKELQSETYEVTGNQNDRYLGAVFVVSTEKGFRSLTMLQSISYSKEGTIRQLMFMAILDMLGITALFMVSKWIVGKSLRPVAKARQHQTEFIAAASHELKSPLAVIRANASAIKIEPERLTHYTEGIDKECSRMSGLIEDMLLLSFADAKSWQVRYEQIDMDSFFIEVYELFYPYCKDKGKKLELEFKEDILPKIECDKERLKQILSILIDNALSYTKDGDNIILRVYSTKKDLIIEVEDHGVGIADEHKKEIFRRFYREDISRKDKNHYGLGLSIAKELTELFGGKIGVVDTAKGGATFFIHLPLHV